MAPTVLCLTADKYLLARINVFTLPAEKQPSQFQMFGHNKLPLVVWREKDLFLKSLIIISCSTKFS